jgi:hypothetical protein
LGTLWLIVFNHLYFLPAMENMIVVGLGIAWGFIFGYAYLERRAKRQKSTTKPSA